MMKQKLVVLTGAGISAESGLRTFRDSDGLWEGYDIEEVATPGAWKKNPEMVLRFYNERRKNVLDAKPNEAHLGLAEMQEDFDVQIITQNIDDLHERAGSNKVLHLHGEIFKMRSDRQLHPQYDIADDMKLGEKAPDGGFLRPAIVWFEEAVPMIEPAIKMVEVADVFVVIGTSLAVYPAAGLLNYVPVHAKVFIIDKKIPPTRHQIVGIEEPASKGVPIFRKMLKADSRNSSE